MKFFYTILILIFTTPFGWAQSISWSIQAEGHYNFLSIKNPTTHFQMSGIAVFFANGTAYYNPTVNYRLETFSNGHIGYGITGKMGIALSERWTYKIGLGIQWKSVELAYQSTTNLYDTAFGTGTTPVLVNFPGIQTGDIHFTNFGAYYASAQQARLYQKSNFWHIQMIPLELDYQLFKNRVSLFLNGQILPIISSNQTYTDADADLEVDNRFRFNQLQFGVETGLSVRIFKKWALRGAYFRGLTNLHNQATIELRSNWNGVSLGIQREL